MAAYPLASFVRCVQQEIDSGNSVHDAVTRMLEFEKGEQASDSNIAMYMWTIVAFFVICRIVL